MPFLLLPLVSLAAGALAALGFAPLDLWPLTLLGVAALMWAVSGCGSAWAAAAHGWLFGTGLFCVSLNWIATAFTFQAKMDAGLGWAAVGGLSLYLGLFIAVPAGLAVRLGGRNPDARVLALIGLLVPAEWLRGLVLTGFAWNPFGAIWLSVPGMAQLAAVGGGIGLTLITLMCSAGLIWLVGGSGRGTRLAGGGMLVAAGLAALAGQARIQPGDVPGARLVVVQPGIGQDERYDAYAAERHLAIYETLTRAALARAAREDGVALPDARIEEIDPGTVAAIDSPLGGFAGKVSGNIDMPVDSTLTAPVAPDVMGSTSSLPTPAAVAATAAARQVIVLWPEGAIDGLLERDPDLRARLAALLGTGELLLAGGTGVGSGSAPYTNSLFAIDSDGRLRGRYDKAHLVPGGEYLPWRWLLEPLGLARLVPGDFDFAAGPGPRTMTLPGLPGVSPVICYEIAFPGAVAQPGARPGWIANVSNDAWFGPWGPPQHLAQARLRAIEEGLPVARATPTGISALIDGNGTVLAQLPAGRADSIVTNLPSPLPPTGFSRFGPWPALAGALACAILAFVLRQRATKQI
jgi:apolipoprotein N-acyltransferase